MDSITAPVLDADRRSPDSPRGTRFNYLLPLSPISINNLPPEMLTAIFADKQFTLRQRIALRSVSTHWRKVIEEHVLKKKTTELILGKLTNPQQTPNDLPLKAELIPLLIRLFPALADLCVTFNSKDYHLLPCLLNAFTTTTTLTTLKLWHIWEESPIDDEPWKIELSTAINSLTALTSLDLVNPPNITVLLPTLDRLQRFDISNTYIEPGMWGSLTAGQPLTRMTHLRMDDVTTSAYTATVQDIVAIFPSLQSLYLCLYPLANVPQDVRLIDIFRSLSTLKHLTELTLASLYYSFTQHYLSASLVNQQLNSVKKLKLHFRNDISSEVLSTVVIRWFPSVESLTLCWPDSFNLTVTTLRIFTRLEALKELVLDRSCYLPIELVFDPAEHRPLTCLKTLDLKLNQYYQYEQFCSSALVHWLPSLTELSIEFAPSLVPLTTAIFRDFSRLENLSILKLAVVHFEADQLHLPTSSDRRLVSVKTLYLAIYLKESADNDSINGRYLFTALAAWFPSLIQLDLPWISLVSWYNNIKDVFIPSITMLSPLTTLEHLTELRYSAKKYLEEHFSLPTSTANVLVNLKKLIVHFDTWIDNNIAAEHHLISVLVAWFPNLQYFAITIYKNLFHLSTELLHQLGRLQYLRELELPQMFYEKKHLQPPSSLTDHPLICLKELSLEMAEAPKNFDSLYFCSTVAAWFPHLEELTIGWSIDPIERDRLTAAYKTAIQTNTRHYFDRKVHLTIEEYYQ